MVGNFCNPIIDSLLQSIIQKFKQAEGLTPGQYRNLHS